MIDITSKIVALVAATVGTGTTIYNTFFKGEYKRRQAYYENLLKPFYVEYKKNPDMSAVEFVEQNAGRDNDNIPKYIFYLVDLKATQEKEQLLSEDTQKNIEENTSDERQDYDNNLKKILLVDYLNLYSNEYNKKISLLEIAQKILNYLMFFLVFVFVFWGALMITAGGMSVLLFFVETNTHISDLLQSLGKVIIGVMLLYIGVIPLKISEWCSEDMYTIKISFIQKIIDRKVRRYDKRFNDFII